MRPAPAGVNRLPRSMREAVSSGSATGHGDGPEPLWPRLASGDLRPAPAGMELRMADERQATRARMRVAGPENPSVRAGTEDERGVRRPGDGGGTRRERDRDIASRGLTSQNRRAMAMGEIRTRVTPGEQLGPGNGELRTRPRRREVRRTTVDGIVDTLVIPEEVANELGLRREARGRSCTPTNGATNGRSGEE